MQYKIPIKILLVEDNPGDARLIQEILKDIESFSIELHHFERLSEAVQFVGGERVDIALLDLSLPDASGLETIIQMKQATPSTPIVVLTGLNDESVALEAVSKGAQDYLVKGSIDTPLLTRAIRYAIERSHLLIRLEQSSEERFRNIIEKSADGMVVVDKSGLIHFVNPAAAFIFNQNPDLIIGKPFIFPIGADERKEWEISTPNGDFKNVEVKVSEIEWERSAALLASIRDVTELKRIEHLKSEIGERKRLDQMKDEFIGVVSHELRTPLTVIKGTIDNLKDEILGPLNKKQISVLHHASSEIDRLTRLINDLLDLSRLESGKTTINEKQIQTKNLIENIIHHFQPLAEKRKIQLHCDISPDTPDLQADEDMMIQILQNLINNALKFSKTKIHVSTKRNSIPREKDISDETESLEEEIWTHVIVEDDGPGIAEEKMAHLFTKFVQIDRQIGGSGYKGTGLGLAICKDIIDLHHGKIWVESKLGEGSRFQFIIPTFSKNQKIQSERHSPPPADVQ